MSRTGQFQPPRAIANSRSDPRRMAPAELPDRFPVEIGVRDGIGARLSAPDHDWSLQVRNVDPTQTDWYVPKGTDANALIPMTFIVPPALAMAPELAQLYLEREDFAAARAARTEVHKILRK